MIEFIWRDKMTKTNKKGEKSPQKRKQNLPVGVMHSFVIWQKPVELIWRDKFMKTKKGNKTYLWGDA